MDYIAYIILRMKIFPVKKIINCVLRYLPFAKMTTIAAKARAKNATNVMKVKSKQRIFRTSAEAQPSANLAEN